MSFSWKDRRDALASIAVEPPELLIIGAGAVGCSVAAHAARLGLDVMVVEKEDIAFGASGNSTGLAHAGLRYLAQGRLGYVFREGRERHRLQELAPQWLHPFTFILPVYQDDPYPFWVVRLGTWIYDLLGWMDSILTKRPLVRRHRIVSMDEVKAKIPGIRADGLLGGIEYYVDAKLEDSRFTLGYAQQAFQHGARFMNHCEVLSTSRTESEGVKVVIKDLLTGQTFEFISALIINATGAWIDGLRERSGMANPLVQKSKGIHLIVDHITDSPLIMSAPVKGKVFFVIPIDAERTLVGTTDTEVAVDPDQVAPDARDVMELLQQLFHFFPYFKQGPNLLKAIESYKQVHVRSVTWGVRPLLRQGGSSLVASREYKLVKDLPHFWSVPGVKLTASRAAGYEAAVEAWSTLRKSVPLPAVSWDSLPGGELRDFDRYVADAQKRFKLGADPAVLIRYLVSMYGTRYLEVIQWMHREPHYGEPLIPGEPWVLAQAAFAVHEEMVLSLNDFLWRRTKWSHYADLPDSVVGQIAETLGKYLSWTEEECRKQIEDYQGELKRHRLS